MGGQTLEPLPPLEPAKPTPIRDIMRPRQRLTGITLASSQKAKFSKYSKLWNGTPVYHVDRPTVRLVIHNEHDDKIIEGRPSKREQFRVKGADGKVMSYPFDKI